MIKYNSVEGTQVDMVYGDKFGELPDFNECGGFANKDEYEKLCESLKKNVISIKEKEMRDFDKKVEDSELNLWFCFVSTLDEKEAERLASKVYKDDLFLEKGNWERLFGRGMAAYGISWADKETIPEISSKVNEFNVDDSFLYHMTVDELWNALYDNGEYWSSENKVKTSDKSGYGLFWFNNDFTEVEIAEKTNFDDKDLTPDIFKTPKKSHYNYDENFLNRKRGRVVLEGGRIIIYVGKNCPTFDPAEYDSEESPKIGINLVIKGFNLADYKYRISIRQDTHWNGYGY
jgi:hypothetical protein